MQTEIKTAKISEIKLNPDNPRTISNKDMELLIKSLKEFPEMLNLREIVVDENMVVLGGNMRLLALQKMGASDCQIRMVSGLTPEQKREFVIKDNSNFGRYDFDSLANEWSDLPLADWGVEQIKHYSKLDDDYFGDESMKGATDYKNITFTFSKDDFDVIERVIKKYNKNIIVSKIIEFCKEIY
jgi:ParB-like chromosome segregation protein Spo0J